MNIVFGILIFAGGYAAAIYSWDYVKEAVGFVKSKV